MVSAQAMEEDDDVTLESDDAESLTNYVRRPQHEICLAEVFKMPTEDLLAALVIKKYNQPGYIPSEVLVTLARSNYGGCARVRNAIALSLNERLVSELGRFLNHHLNWYGVMARSSEAEVEAIAYVRDRIFRSKVDVSFAEVSFGPFVGTRLLDWFKAEVALKNSVPSIDGLKAPADEDGNELSLADQVVDEVGLTPEETLARKQLLINCRGAVLQLPEKQRTALMLCFHQEMTHKQAGEVMGLGESSVQKYVKAALNALRNGDWHD